MKGNNFTILLLCLCSSLAGQNVYDGDHRAAFGNYLYGNREYAAAANEYRHALFLGNCGSLCRERLFDAYIRAGQYAEGIGLYRSVYPGGLSGNDTLEMLYGRLLLLNDEYGEIDSLVSRSRVLNAGQQGFLSLSRDLFSGDWDNALERQAEVIGNPLCTVYLPAMDQISQAKYRKPWAGLMLSAVVPGSGKMYAGYWYDGLFTLTTIALSAWQAYRGITLYGTDRAYGWIFLAFSVSFYIGDLYGSFKAVNMRNHTTRQRIHHDIEKAFNSVASY